MAAPRRLQDTSGQISLLSFFDPFIHSSLHAIKPCCITVYRAVGMKDLMLNFKALLLTGVGEEASGKGKIKGQLLSKARLAGSSPAEEVALAYWAHWSGSDCLSWKAPQGVRDGGLALPCSLPPAGQGRARRFRSRCPQLDGQPPDGGYGVDHESLRFSFSEQRVSLNCL